MGPELYCGSNFSDTPFMQYRCPVGCGPSSNTWPRWPPQFRQCTSTRVMPCVVSLVVATALGNGFQKLGQPDPLSYLVLDSNSGWLHAAQWNTPVLFSKFNGLVPARSVPCWRRTRNWSAERTS